MALPAKLCLSGSGIEMDLRSCKPACRGRNFDASLGLSQNRVDDGYAPVRNGSLQSRKTPLFRTRNVSGFGGYDHGRSIQYSLLRGDSKISREMGSGLQISRWPCKCLSAYRLSHLAFPYTRGLLGPPVK